ncbi:MAG TPA: ornithine cyclodeaminase family protein [Candidatus Corynebacterium gallistercoris]|uniref:Ornithine cyclodeaminase family protein n=1 Tax=Candidatus Corynebacterium gallistercoris TaxID=2838530 RepID=A0A9D1RZT0_9CORY|nr:ornithine cyclodeaminase family protein [Candidatus Corynebacterium gallistercoris]
MRTIGYERALELLTPADAVDLIRDTLKSSFDPSNDLDRIIAPLSNGEFLIMPSELDSAFGIKVISVADSTATNAQARIQGSYLLFDGESMSPTHTIDGVAITNLRTPAASLAGIKDFLIADQQPLEAFIFGTGPQARWHAHTLKDMLRGYRDVTITFCSRTKPRDVDTWVEAGSPEAQRKLGTTGLIICATTAGTPLFGSDDIAEDAIIVAVGSHSPDKREVGSEVIASAQVIVEDMGAALREAGDIILAVKDGSIREQDLTTVKDLLMDPTQFDHSHRILFKTTGMSWQDLVLAQAIARRDA